MVEKSSVYFSIHIMLGLLLLLFSLGCQQFWTFRQDVFNSYVHNAFINFFMGKNFKLVEM